MNMRSFSQRRRVLLQLLATAATGWSGAALSDEGPKLSRDPFGLGIASGSPSSDGFVLWTRLVGDELDEAHAVPVTWEVLERDSSRVLAHGTSQALPELGYSVHVEVAGLPSDQWYKYRFRVGNFTSPTGFTRTMPAPNANATRLRFAYASCQRWEDGYYAAYRHMAGENLDFVIFLGDYIYEYQSRKQRNAVRTHSLREAKTLQDYRDRYALYKSDAQLQHMHAACPWFVTWDDHEVENNYAGDISTQETEEFESRRIAAYQAYYEHMPLRAATLVSGLKGLQHSGELRLFQSMDFGRLARLYLLDSRQYRDRPLCGANPPVPLANVCQARPNEEHSMLGHAQETWLRGAMERSRELGSKWNFVCQQTGFTPRNYKKGRGHGFSRDGWDGYWQARDRLIGDIAKTQVHNPVIIGGDIHQNWVANVHKDPYDVRSPVVASEFCGTSITSRSGVPAEKTAELISANPHCVFNDAQHRGYGVVEVTLDATTVWLRALHDPESQDSGIYTLATYAVEPGRPGIRAVEKKS